MSHVLSVACLGWALVLFVSSFIKYFSLLSTICLQPTQLSTLTFVCSQDHSVPVLHHTQHAQLDVGQSHLLPVHLHPHPLQEGHLGGAQPHCHGPQPGEGHGVPGVVGDPDGEGVVGEPGRGAVPGEEVLAGALEVEDLPVEGLVVRVPEDGADPLRGRGEDLAGPAGGAAVPGLGDGLGPRRTLRTLHTGALDLSRPAGALTAPLPVTPAGPVVVGLALVVADLPGPRLAGGGAGGGEGGGAGAGGAGVGVEGGPRLVELVPPEAGGGPGSDERGPGADRAAGPRVRPLEGGRTGEDGAGLDGAGQDPGLAPALPAGRGRVWPHLALLQLEAGEGALGVETDGAALAGDYDGVVTGEGRVTGLSVLGEDPVMAEGHLARSPAGPPPLPGPEARPVQSAGAALITTLTRPPLGSEAPRHGLALPPPVLTLGAASDTGAHDAGVEVGDARDLHIVSVRLVAPVVLPGQLAEAEAAAEEESC